MYFVATKDMFCHNKHEFVMIKLLSRQKRYLWQLPPLILYTLLFLCFEKVGGNLRLFQAFAVTCLVGLPCRSERHWVQVGVPSDQSP